MASLMGNGLQAKQGITVALIVAGAVEACASSVPRPKAADAAWAAGRWPGISAEDLEHGRDGYVRRCAGCHQLYPPEAYAASRWPELVRVMADRARIRDPERTEIERYLV